VASAPTHRIDQLVDEPWCLNVGHLEANVISAFHAKGVESPRQIVTTNSNQLKHALVATAISCPLHRPQD